MRNFKLLASRGDTIIFDDRVEAQNPRAARSELKRRLGLQSLQGVVYTITELPIEVLRAIIRQELQEYIAVITQSRATNRRAAIAAIERASSVETHNAAGDEAPPAPLKTILRRTRANRNQPVLSHSDQAIAVQEAEDNQGE